MENTLQMWNHLIEKVFKMYIFKHFIVLDKKNFNPKEALFVCRKET
jgi:hypothetical protein